MLTSTIFKLLVATTTVLCLPQTPTSMSFPTSTNTVTPISPVSVPVSTPVSKNVPSAVPTQTSNLLLTPIPNPHRSLDVRQTLVKVI